MSFSVGLRKSLLCSLICDELRVLQTGNDEVQEGAEKDPNCLFERLKPNLEGYVVPYLAKKKMLMPLSQSEGVRSRCKLTGDT